MQIKKAIITAGGPDQRQLPLQQLVDSQGKSQSALSIILDEINGAGVENIGVVVSKGDAEVFSNALGEGRKRITFIEQETPSGYGHAVWSAREYSGEDPFLLLVSDHLYVSSEGTCCARQLVNIAVAENCAVSAVQATHESKLPDFGVIGGRLEPGKSGLYEVTEVLEKPSPTRAEQSLVVPGLRAGRYLCFFGMHALTPGIMHLLDEQHSAGNHLSLSAALDQLGKRERYLATELDGRRYDLGQKYGLLTAQLAIALGSEDRDEVMTMLVELLAQSKS